MLFDYHTHTIYSHPNHARGTMEENVQAAVERGLSAIAISDHGPEHVFYGLDRSKWKEMREEVDRLNQRYPEIEIYLSVEADICESENGLDIDEDDRSRLDFVIAGYHFGSRRAHCIANWIYRHLTPSGRRMARAEAAQEPTAEIPRGPLGRWLTRLNTQMYLRAIEKGRIRILTHPGDKGPVDMDAIARACSEKGVWMEISTHHPHLTREEIQIAMKYDVDFVISSDAHRPAIVGTYKGGLARAEEAGLDIDRIVNIQS